MHTFSLICAELDHISFFVLSSTCLLNKILKGRDLDYLLYYCIPGSQNLASFYKNNKMLLNELQRAPNLQWFSLVVFQLYDGLKVICVQ